MIVQASDGGTHRWSEPANEIFGALAKAQASIKNALRDATNPHFRSKYADLASVKEACWEHLTAAGIAVVQMPVNVDQNVGVVTLLAHDSGQWIESTVFVQPTKFDAQGVGSVITYLRRYSLAAMAGVAPDDDDGEAAVGRPAPQEARTAPGFAAAGSNGARRQQAAPAPSEAALEARAKVKQLQADIDGLGEAPEERDQAVTMLADISTWLSVEQLEHKMIAAGIPATDRQTTLEMLQVRAANRRRKLLGRVDAPESDGLEAFDGR